jgi:acetyl-CoA carboxylase carboxyltransferase component
MLETDGLFRLAASNFEQAETHLDDAEVQLQKLRARLDKCLELVRQMPRDEAPWQEVGVIFKKAPEEAAAAPTT